MSLDIQIKVDASGAVAASNKAEAALGAVEKQGAQLGAAMNRLGQSFKNLDGVMQARARSTQLHATLNNNLANSFAGIATQIDRERRMLDSIHGPMQRYQQDVRTLDALMKRGAITINEYNAQLGKMRAQAGMGNPMDAVSLPGAPKAAGGGRLAGLAAAAAPIAGMLGAQQVLALSDSYTNLENRLRQVATSQSNLNELMARTKEVANATRSDWATTAESFVRLSQATKHLGISQERGLKITETLNMALQSSGASSSEAAAGTLQLMQAMSAGALAGDEFKSIAENMPVLMDILSKQLGVTRGELKKMGAEGKITTDVMIKGLEAAAATVRDNFGKSVPTAAQQWTIFKNEMMQTVGEFMRSTNVIPRLGEALKSLADGLKIVVGFFSTISSIGSAVSGAFDKLGNAARIAMGPIGMIGKTFGYLGDIIDTFLPKQSFMAKAWEEAHGKLNKLNLGVKEVQTGLQELAKDPWADDLVVDLDVLIAKAKEFAVVLLDPWSNTLHKRSGVADAIDQMIGSAIVGFDKLKSKADAAKRAGGGERTFAREDEQGLHSKFALETQFRSQTSFAGVTDISAGISSATLQAVIFQRELENIALAARKYELDMASANDGVSRGFNKIGDEIANTAQLTEDMLVGAFHNLEDAIVQMALTGEISFGNMIRQMQQDLMRLGIRNAMQGIIGAINPHGLGGQNNLPGFASGGSFMVGGHGGADTTPVAFMATPGERVTVETSGQQNDPDPSGGASGAPISLAIHLDERDALKALETPAGQRVVARVIRRMYPQLKTELTGR